MTSDQRPDLNADINAAGDSMAADDGAESLEAVVQAAALRHGVTVLGLEPPARGSRRRRIWELDGNAHCPVVGTCLPIAALRRVVDKVLGARAVADDYELHCGVIADCKLRTPIAEAVQRELDRRCMPALRQAAACKTTQALADWWDAGKATHAVAGPLWAVLTHPRCTPALALHVLGDVHMLQHQAGMAARVDTARFAALEDECVQLRRELELLRRRTQHSSAEAAQRRQALEAEVMRMRAASIVRDSTHAQLRDELCALEAQAPLLKARADLAREVHEQARTIRALQRELRQARQAQLDAERQRAESPTPADKGEASAAVVVEAPPEDLPRLNQRAVLCVGGRTAIVPVYRRIVEQRGGRFLHHDGGEEQSPAQLEATLAAADLVICQAGCVSHEAYWRVKTHCRRTGKRCVFVETPSSAGLKRALLTLAPALAGAPASSKEDAS